MLHPGSSQSQFSYGSQSLSDEHARETARVLSEMNPDFIGALTLMVLPGTELYEEVQTGSFKLVKPIDIYHELRIMVEGLNLSNCIFRVNHASNYIPIGGKLPQDKLKILKTIDDVIVNGDKNFKPEWMRGL